MDNPRLLRKKTTKREFHIREPKQHHDELADLTKDDEREVNTRTPRSYANLFQDEKEIGEPEVAPALII